MSGNHMERTKTAIKRKRGDLIELDYFDLANKMISDDVFSEEKHRQIKRDRKSDSGRMDELLDVIIESSSDATIQSFMNAVQKQNQALAKKIKDDYELNYSEEEVERISFATDIFCNTQSDFVELISPIESPGNEDEANIPITNADRRTSFVSSTSTAVNDIIAARSDNNLQYVDYIPSETQVFQLQSNFTQRTYTMKEVHEKLNTALSFSSFRIETCWIKGFDTMYYRKGADMVYKGCYHVVNGRHCKKRVFKVNAYDTAEDLYECGAKHRTSGYVNVPHLKFLQLEDSTGSVKEVTMFSENVEYFLNMKAEEILNLDEKGVKRAVDNIRSYNYMIILKCTPRNRVISSQVMEIPSSPFDWDFVATIAQRRIVAPHLRVTLL